MTNIILCGGSGTRLWPLSRTLMPKQFVKLFEGESLFQKTVTRNQKACDSQFIVSNAEQYFLAVDQIEELASNHESLALNADTHVVKTKEGCRVANHSSSYLLEPVGRNTAPAIALACFALDPEEIVLVTPSDHLIKDEKAYLEAVEKAKNLAREDNLVTFGITPQYAETGFGYIEAELQNSATGYGLGATNEGLDVVSFKEKPDLQTAEGYLTENVALSTQHLALKYYWNSGMFMFKAGLFLEELQKYSPDIYEASKLALANKTSDTLLRISHETMAAIPEESIDYAVMEKSSKVKVVPSDIDWSDLGSFDALYEELPKGDLGNAILYHTNKLTLPHERRENHFQFNPERLTLNAKNNLIISEKLVTAIDIDDLIIIDTADALLVSKKGSSQKVKEVVKILKEKNSELPNIHLTAHRPLGNLHHT